MVHGLGIEYHQIYALLILWHPLKISIKTYLAIQTGIFITRCVIVLIVHVYFKNICKWKWYKGC
jgi:hypothetical protein